MGSFQDLLNRIRTINIPGVSMPEPEVPSQMPGAIQVAFPDAWSNGRPWNSWGSIRYTADAL